MGISYVYPFQNRNMWSRMYSHTKRSKAERKNSVKFFVVGRFRIGWYSCM